MTDSHLSTYERELTAPISPVQQKLGKNKGYVCMYIYVFLCASLSLVLVTLTLIHNYFHNTITPPPPRYKADNKNWNVKGKQPISVTETLRNSQRLPGGDYYITADMQKDDYAGRSLSLSLSLSPPPLSLWFTH